MKMESSGSNSYQLTDCQSSSNTESLVTKEFEIVRFDISGLPKKYQSNAKLQLLGNSFVKLTPLSALVHKKQNVISSVEPLAMHSDLAKKPILNTFIDNSKRCVKNVTTQTEAQPQIDFLQRGINCSCCCYCSNLPKYLKLIHFYFTM